MKNRYSDVILGLLFFGTLIGLGIVTIVLSDISLTRETHDILLFSDDVGYLRAGDPILLHGMPAGKVMEIERLENPVMARVPATDDLVPCTVKIITRMDVNPYEMLSIDYSIRIEDRGLLGGKLLRFEAGKSARSVEAGAPLLALATTSPWQAVATFIEENRDTVSSAISHFDETFRLASEGEGLLSAALNDPGMRDDWAAASADVRALSADLRDFTSEIKKGESTLARLIYDDDLYQETKSILDNSDSIVTDFKGISARLAAGEGTLGKLLSEDAVLYEHMEKIAADIDRFMSKVDAGEGVMGALLTDDEFAEEVRSIVKQMRGAIEDARETAPVQEVGSFLFGTF
jgi:phospholipid/cholesterol/gamma-HCH transport system substrate-binding protein